MREEATTLRAGEWPKYKIVALRDERGSYNPDFKALSRVAIVALRDERGSYNVE